MNKVISIVFPFIKVITLMSSCYLISGCGKSELQVTSVDYLLPQLRNQEVKSLELSSSEGATTLTRKEGVWWVANPVDYLAEPSVIESFLRTLADAEAGKQINIANKDLHELKLKRNGAGITARIVLDDSEFTLVFGSIDYPKESSGIMGVAYTARRYIRVIGETDKSFLVPVSLVDLSAAPTLWTDAEYIRIPSLRSLKVVNENTVTHHYSREHMFGALYSHDQNGEKEKVDPNLFSCFESFLKQGRCLQMGNADENINEVAVTALVVEDFWGTTFTFKIGTRGEATRQAKERARLQAGFLSDGVAPTPVAMMLEVSSVDVELDSFEQALKEQNLIVAKRLAGRVAFSMMRQLDCVFDLLAGEK